MPVKYWAGFQPEQSLLSLSFLKANYFAISLPLVAASFLFWRPNIQRVLGLALGFCIVFFAMLAYLRFDIRTVVEAFWMAAGARSKALNLLVLTLPTDLAIAGSPDRDHNSFLWNSPREVCRLLVGRSSMAHLDASRICIGLAANAFQHATTGDASSRCLCHPDRQSRHCGARNDCPVAEARTELSHHVFVLVLCALLVVPQLASDLVGLANGVFQKAHPSTTMGLVTIH